MEGRDGEDGLTVLRSNKDTALILCDVNMPVMDGITFAFALKEEDGLKDIPLIMCTTETVESVREDIKELGIRAWMTKPVSKKLLILALKKYLSSRFSFFFSFFIFPPQAVSYFPERNEGAFLIQGRGV